MTKDKNAANHKADSCSEQDDEEPTFNEDAQNASPNWKVRHDKYQTDEAQSEILQREN